MASLTPSAVLRASASARSPSRILLLAARMRAWLFLALLLILFEVWAEASYGASFVFSSYNAQSIAIFAVAPLLLALGETFVIIAGGIDLSVGFIMGLSAVIAAHGANMAGAVMPAFPAMLVGIAAGLLVSLIPGAVNGWLISKLKVPPFIGTLGMFGVARGAAFLLAAGTTVPVTNAYFAALGNGRVLGFPIVVVITILFLLVMSYMLGQTRFGQHTYAVGASEQAALRAGINVGRHTRKLYLLSALCAGLGGVLYTARFTAGAAQAGEPLLLDSIAAVVIGGASLFGGSGTILGTVAGSLVIAVIQYGLVFIDVEPFWQFVAVGVVIIISVLVDQTPAQARGRALMSAVPSAALQPILDVREVDKRFGGVEALKGVSLALYPGEVVALAGDNGAGKSTLTKMISGVYPADGGEIRLDGAVVRFATPEAARHAGIETIYQDLALADNLSIGANIFLGREPMRRALGLLPVLDRGKMAAAAKETMARLDFHVDRLDAPVGRFSGGQRQAVAIGRAMYWNARVILMDEPTAALGVPEQRKVLSLIQSLKAQGRGVLFISHNLQDIFAVADRIVVLRRGSLAGERRIGETTHDEVVKLMIGG